MLHLEHKARGLLLAAACVSFLVGGCDERDPTRETQAGFIHELHSLADFRDGHEAECPKVVRAYSTKGGVNESWYELESNPAVDILEQFRRAVDRANAKLPGDPDALLVEDGESFHQTLKLSSTPPDWWKGAGTSHPYRIWSAQTLLLAVVDGRTYVVVLKPE